MNIIIFNLVRNTMLKIRIKKMNNYIEKKIIMIVEFFGRN